MVVRLALPTTEESDADLIRRLTEQDHAALRLLYERHAAWILARLRVRCHDDDIAREALQDTFVAIWNKPSWNGTGLVPAWLWGIAARRLFGVLRQRNRWLPVTGLTGDDPADPVDLLRHLVDTDIVDFAMATLDDDLRVVVRSIYLDELSVEETSVLLGVPTGTVKSRLHRARRRMQEVLDA